MASRSSDSDNADTTEQKAHHNLEEKLEIPTLNDKKSVNSLSI